MMIQFSMEIYQPELPERETISVSASESVHLLLRGSSRWLKERPSIYTVTK